MDGLSNLLNSVFSAGEAGRISVFFKRSLLILVTVTIFDLGVKALVLPALKGLSLETKVILLALSFTIPLVVNFVWFLLARYSMFGIRFSNKTNIVFAFNLQGTNSATFFPEYQKLIASVENEIASKNLGESIKVITATSDIRLKGKSAAEAKVLLGLSGATLFIWGHVKQVKGKEKFVTTFSYEFGRPNTKTETEAKRDIDVYIGNALSKGLFSDVETDPDVFAEQILPSAFFLLGVSTFSLNLQEKSIEFLEGFQKFYDQADVVRKNGMSDALSKCHEMQVILYRTSLPYLTSESEAKDCERAKELSLKILAIEPKDYTANLSLAFLYDLAGDSATSEHYSNLAEKYAPTGLHHHLFNKAYFALKKRKYAEAIKIYRRIPDNTTVNTLDVSNYLNRQFQRDGNLALVFADGYISYRWGDKDMGRNNLKSFKEIADQVDLKDLAEIVDENGNLV